MTDEMTARALRSSWRASEQSLYSIGGGDVERYQRAIRLVRAVVDELQDVTSTDALADRWPGAGGIVSAAVERAGLMLGSLPLDQVAGAAFALRQTALQIAESRRARSEQIVAARAEGTDWVLLHETGDPLAGFADPYSSTSMHLGSGLAIVAAVQPDLTTGAAVCTLTVIRLDRQTGDLVDDDPGVADLTCADGSDIRSGQAALRATVEELAAAERIG